MEQNIQYYIILGWIEYDWIFRLLVPEQWCAVKDDLSINMRLVLLEYRQTDSGTGRQTDRHTHTHTHTDRQTDREGDRQRERQIDRQIDRKKVRKRYLERQAGRQTVIVRIKLITPVSFIFYAQLSLPNLIYFTLP